MPLYWLAEMVPAGGIYYSDCCFRLEWGVFVRETTGFDRWVVPYQRSKVFSTFD